jgi:ubiquinone/menaquinone biosynthesis C-methylase UbiE
MSDRTRPESLEGRWDILYRDYPQVYEEWSRIEKRPDFLDVIAERFGLQDKVIVDVGSGTGASTCKLAECASLVIGVELEAAMIALAIEDARQRGITNVRFQMGDAEHLPLADRSVDAAVAITLAGGDVRTVAKEMERVVRRGGLVLRGDMPPGWYGGELNPVITGKPRDEVAPEGSRDHVLSNLGYERFDVLMDQDYGSVERVVRTYGFIHSQRAIDYIREHQVTSIRWKACVRFKIVA